MYSYKYPHPAITADCVVFAVDDDTSRVLLVQRKNEPEKGKWAFPGGFMNIDETTEEAAKRELKEETGLEVDEVIQVGVFDTVDRDPRERVISVAYLTALDHLPAVTGGDDASQAQWFRIDEMPELAFDHQEIFHAAFTKLMGFGTQSLFDGLDDDDDSFYNMDAPFN